MADVAMIAEGKVLLVRYRDTKRYDGQTGWFLPDDFLQELEHPDQAAARIGKEQTGTTLRNAKMAFVESFGNGAWHLIFHYRADFSKRPKTRPGGNVASMEWFDLDDLPPADEVAHHGWCLETLARLLKEAAW